MTLLGRWAEVTGPPSPCGVATAVLSPRLAGVSAPERSGALPMHGAASARHRAECQLCSPGPWGTEGTPAPIPFLGRRPRLLPPRERASKRARAESEQWARSTGAAFSLSICLVFRCMGAGPLPQHTAPLSPTAATVLTGTRAQRLLGDGGHTAVRVGVLGCFSLRVRHSQPAKSTSSPSERLMKAWF